MKMILPSCQGIDRLLIVLLHKVYFDFFPQLK